MMIMLLEWKKLVNSQPQHMDKESLIHKLTLLDTQSYRCIRICNNRLMGESISVKEPPQFRHKLYNIYKELTVEQLNSLYHIRKNLER